MSFFDLERWLVMIRRRNEIGTHGCCLPYWVCLGLWRGAQSSIRNLTNLFVNRLIPFAVIRSTTPQCVDDFFALTHCRLSIVEANELNDIVSPPKKIADRVADTETTSFEASQVSKVASLSFAVAPRFNSYTSNLTSAEENRLPERQPLSSTTPLSLVGGFAGFESPANDRQFLSLDSESDQQEARVADLLDETFATYVDDLDS